MKFRSRITTTPQQVDSIQCNDPVNDNDHSNEPPAIQLVEPGNEAPYVVTGSDLPPDGGYGWVCTASFFMINAHTWGVNSVSLSTQIHKAADTDMDLQAWAVFLSHYLEDQTFPDATQFEYALIGGLSISQSMFIAPVIAWSIRRFGTEITLGIGTLLVFGSLFGASYATEVWHLFLTQGVGFGWGLGFTYIPAAAVLPQWFTKKRSLAVGLASSGAGAGGIAYNLIAGVAIRNLGINWSYRVIALCTLLVNGVSSALMRDRNKIVKPKQDALDWREFGHIEVIFVIIWGFLSELGYVVLLFSLPHYATTIGLSQGQGSVVGAVLNVGLCVSRPLVGYLSDRFGRINMATFMTASCGVSCLALWVPAKNYALLLIFALFAGLGCGTFWGTVTAITAEVVGLRRLPTAFGIICVALVTPTLFAEPIGLQLVSASGYTTSQVFVGMLYIVAAFNMWFLRSWKITEIQEKVQVEGVEGYDSLDRFHAGKRWLVPRKLILPMRV